MFLLDKKHKLFYFCFCKNDLLMRTIELDVRPKRNQRPQWMDSLEKNWFRILILTMVLHIFFNKDISIQFNMNAAGQIGEPLVIQPIGYENHHQQKVSVTPVSQRSSSQTKAKMVVPPEANNFSNLGFILNPDYARRKKIDRRIVRQKLENCQAYIKTYEPIARKEREKYGIPVSITLAQGLLESNAGDSRLAGESNNHFGIKCRTKCLGCTCRNYSDDDIYDMFRVFESTWESFREHSILLSSNRYKHLKKLSAHDYKKWAHGLKKAGYATDKRYAEKLIRIIEELDLDRFDRVG
jgi:flagellum-specific peptidoglycan hydrolase FlgJ